MKKTGEHEKPAEKTKAAKSTTPAQAQLNIGMIGHVDHGKTSLTQALTGKWTDTHSEEVKRGISIRLGYADAVFYKGKDKADKILYANDPKDPRYASPPEVSRAVSFVDAPGHETLLTTMLSGAALMNGAVLVISASEECPQPQTEEHLMALKLMGVERVVVAQNKIDLVDQKRAMESHKQITAFLAKYGYKDIPIVPVAANFRANIDLLIEAIETHIPNPHYDENAPLRMHVARSFDINKPGTKISDLRGGVLGGSIIRGKIKIGDTIEISPGLENTRFSTKVVSLSTANGTLSSAHAGGLIGIGTELDPSICQNDRFRGQVIGAVGTLPAPTKQLKLKMHYLERLVGGATGEIKTNDPLVLTAGTSTLVGFASRMTTGGTVDVDLKNDAVVEKGEKISISKRMDNRWRLVGYGVVQ